MRPNPFREAGVSWLLALGLPIAAGAIMWLVMGATVTHHQCVTGAGKSSAEVIALLGLIALPAVIIAAHARRAGTQFAYVISPLVVSVFFGGPLQFLVISAWWGGHNCMT